jgi:hypothetical protein
VGNSTFKFSDPLDLGDAKVSEIQVTSGGINLLSSGGGSFRSTGKRSRRSWLCQA